MSHHVFFYNLSKQISIVTLPLFVWFIVVARIYIVELSLFCQPVYIFMDANTLINQMALITLNKVLLMTLFISLLVNGLMLVDEVCRDYISSKKAYKLTMTCAAFVTFISLLLAVTKVL